MQTRMAGEAYYEKTIGVEDDDNEQMRKKNKTVRIINLKISYHFLTYAYN